MSDVSEADRSLSEALGASQRLGFLGDRPVPEIIRHARAFVDALQPVTGCVLDLGAGGGVPGLVIAVDRPDLSVTLLDRRTKRADFLARMVHRLQLADRVSVVAAEVDDAIRDGLGTFDAVVARGFGPPAFTVRTAVRCLRPEGMIVVSEPPTGDRWDPALLEQLGLGRRPTVGSADTRVVCLVREAPTGT